MHLGYICGCPQGKKETENSKGKRERIHFFFLKSPSFVLHSEWVSGAQLYLALLHPPGAHGICIHTFGCSSSLAMHSL
jgi:hypothetical protein